MAPRILSALALALGAADANGLVGTASTLTDFQSMTGQMFYQFIDYNALYGPGNGFLCYKVIVGVTLLAVQNTCDQTCCARAVKGGNEGFNNLGVDVFANWDTIDPITGMNTWHNFQSDVGPGPWVVAMLNDFGMNDGTTWPNKLASTCNCGGRVSPPCPCQTEPDMPVNYGLGYYDMFPCPRMSDQNPGGPKPTCDPTTCFQAGNPGGLYPGELWGCYGCNNVGTAADGRDMADLTRNAFVFYQHGTPASPELEVYHTVQRWESIASNQQISRTVIGPNFQNCVYLAMVTLVYDPPSPPPPVPPAPSPPPPVVTVKKDPHLHFAHGGVADLRGEDGGVFNFLSAKNVSLNVKTEAADFKWAHRIVHGTKLSAVFWTIRTSANHLLQIAYDSASADRAIVRNLNQTVEEGERTLKASIDGNAYGTTYWLDNVFVKLAGRVLIVTVQDKWRMAVKQSPFPFAALNLKKSLLDVSAQALYDADHDVVAPHGLFGQSYDGDDFAVDGKVDKRTGDETTTEAQAEGAIEGVYTDYKIDASNPFSTAFKYSRFDATAAAPRDVTKLTGVKRARVANPAHTVSSTDVPTDYKK